MTPAKVATPTAPKDDALRQVQAARAAGAPIIVLETPDQQATRTRLAAALATAEDGDGKLFDVPVVNWDLVRGIVGVNKAGVLGAGVGQAMRDKIVPQPLAPNLPSPDKKPDQALLFALKFPPETLFFMTNAQRIVDDPSVAQGIMNLRDEFKRDGRTLVLLGPSVAVPPELTYDVIVIEEPLPSEPEIERIVQTCVDDTRKTSTPNFPVPSPEQSRRAAECLSGLTAFAAEQATSMAIATGDTKRGLNEEDLLRRKRRAVNATAGLTMETPTFTFADVAGLEQMKIFGRELFEGNQPPRLVVRIDEIDKMMAATGAGANGASDSSGTQADALGVTLRELEENGWTGLVAVGPAGSGKSLVSTALGATYGRPTCNLDFGAMRNKFVGASEERVRAVMRTLKAIGKGDVFFCATCNKLDALPPELKRRFRCGVWFFDLPSKEERDAIWALQMTRYKLSPEQVASRADVDDTNWTGAEIRNCCELAWRFNSPLTAAVRYITPIWKQDPEGIDRLRRLADGRFLSASYEGAYKFPGAILEQAEKERAEARAEAPSPARRIRGAIRES